MRFFDEMTVTLPDGKSGSTEIRRFTVEAAGFINVLSNSQGGRGFGLRPGDTYTGLYRDGTLWMSDTPDERRDLYDILSETAQMKAERVLIHGLGLGMLLNALIKMDHVRHIDVVELDPDVIELVAEHYVKTAAEAGVTLEVHQGDAYTYTFPPGTRWDIAWHDIWADLCESNLAQMTQLHRRYARRVRWQDSWGKQFLLRRRRLEERQNRRMQAYMGMFRSRNA